MKWMAAFLVLTCGAFAEQITVNNQTSYPKKEMQMGIQWASTAQEVATQNAIPKLEVNSFLSVQRSGKVDLDSPEGAQYFRIVVWKKGEAEPELLTNWVDIQPSKTYTLKDAQLVPAVLMAGMGC